MLGIIAFTIAIKDNHLLENNVQVKYENKILKKEENMKKYRRYTAKVQKL